MSDTPSEDVVQAVSSLYLVLATEELERRPDDLDDLLSSVADHNQLMLDTIEIISPTLRETLKKMMSASPGGEREAHAYIPNSQDEVVWHKIINDMFTAVEAKLTN